MIKNRLILGMAFLVFISSTVLLAADSRVTEESLGLRKTDIYTEKSTVADRTEYIAAAPGASKVLERAFDNAPPMISHDVDGLLPITKENNSCIGCHAPEVAPSLNAKSFPKSHTTDFRPKIETKNGLVNPARHVSKGDTTVSIDLKGQLSQSRYNCSQCHAPQSTGKLAVENSFRPDFQSKDARYGSNLLDVVNSGI